MASLHARSDQNFWLERNGRGRMSLSGSFSRIVNGRRGIWPRRGRWPANGDCLPTWQRLRLLNRFVAQRSGYERECHRDKSTRRRSINPRWLPSSIWNRPDKRLHSTSSAGKFCDSSAAPSLPRRCPPSVPPGTPPAGSPPGPPASCASCLLSVSPAASACAKCRRRSTWPARSCASPGSSPAR